MDRLSNISRDNYDGWKSYLQAYYTNFDALHSWASLGFYRRWRRTREINGERLKARFKNTLLRPNTTMPQPTPVTANAHDLQQQQEAVAPPLAPSSPSAEQPAPRERSPQLPEVQRRPEENIVAWGAGKFGNRRGTAPMPNEALKKYVARFARVVLIPEYNTSQSCLCGRKTEPYKVSKKTCMIMPQPTLRFSFTGVRTEQVQPYTADDI